MVRTHNYNPQIVNRDINEDDIVKIYRIILTGFSSKNFISLIFICTLCPSCCARPYSYATYKIENIPLHLFVMTQMGININGFGKHGTRNIFQILKILVMFKEDTKIFLRTNF